MTTLAAAKPATHGAYASLEQRYRRLNLVRDALGVLQWDMAAMMPAGGADVRGDQLATLKVVAHEMLTDPAMGDLLAAAEAQAGLDSWQRANLREMRREWVHATAVPGELVATLSKAVSDCEMRWRDARAANDFKGLLPLMRRVLDLTRESRASRRPASTSRRTTPFWMSTSPAAPRPRSTRCSAIWPDSCRASSIAFWKSRNAIIRFAPRRAVSGREAKRPGARDDDRVGLRFRAWPPRHQPSSVLRRRARRCAPDHALGRERFPLRPDGRAARDGTCALRARPAQAVASSAGGAGARHERA